MKFKSFFLLLSLALLSSTAAFAQSADEAAIKKVIGITDHTNIDKMRAFFYKLDDAFNVAMVKKDSLFFTTVFADAFINCTPLGDINAKKEEISTLLQLPFIHVERTASKYDIFTYSEKVATMSVTKKITKNDSSIIYVRRTIVYQLIDGKWLIVSGQGTNVLSKYID